MDANTFREFGKAAVDFIADYMENIRDCDVLPSVKPGYLLDLLPKEMPNKSENWTEILTDINRVIKPGITHWQSPNMHAYYPTATSFPSIVGDMLASGFGVMGFSWICSPACTELEVVVMDWMAKFLNLPSHFLHSSHGPGGGVIQGSASEAVLIAVLAAREQAVLTMREQHPELSESEIRGKLIAYSSDQSNSCIEKAGLLAAVPIRLLATCDDLILSGSLLQKALDEDLSNGFIPILCIATIGTTGTGSHDDIVSLGEVCNKHGIWLHVDAAYAGAVFALDEYADLRKGINLVDSFNFNLHKMLMINFDCCGMWLKDASRVADSFNVDRIYLKHKYEGKSQIPDFRHWQIPLGRRFRALKVWVTLRSVGANGLKAHVRNHIALAKRFEEYILNDSRFEIVKKRSLGLVCFRPIGDNELTAQLLHRITEHKKIYLIQASFRGQQFLRFVVCGMQPTEKDVDYAWHEILCQFQEVLKQRNTSLSLPITTKVGVETISQQLTVDLKINHPGSKDVEKLK